MTPEERDVLLPLLDKVRQTQLPEKDAEAAQYIQQAQQQQPDLAYILTQTVLMQDYALHQAQARIQALEQQGGGQRTSGGGSFLGGLFGGGARPAAQPAAGPWGQAPQQSPYAQPMAAAYSTMGQGGQPSFLRGAAQTAMGIAGGALLFQGVESLLGGGHGYGGGGFMGGGFGPGQGFVENNTEVVNNYYDQPAPDNASTQADTGDYSSADYDTSSDFGGDDDSFGI